jgi:hypothetical protein
MALEADGIADRGEGPEVTSAGFGVDSWFECSPVVA